LIWQLIIKLIECKFINNFIEKSYNQITKGKQVERLNTEEIFSKMKALLFHKLGDFFVNGTDNLIIAKISGLVTLGMFANYFMVISVVTSILTTTLNSITANIGNELAKAKQSYLVENKFLKLNAVCNLIFTLISLGFVINIDWFIGIWLGTDFIIESATKYILSINLYLLGTRVVSGLYKNAAGVFEPDRYAPLIQGFINLFFSILLGLRFGLNGVLIGTAISSLMVPFWNRPYVLYKYVFKISSKKYWYELLVSCSIYIVMMVICFFSDEYKQSVLSSITLSIIMSITLVFMSLASPSTRNIVKNRTI
jgi:O-antigen/teichoic acid export membrane protein